MLVAEEQTFKSLYMTLSIFTDQQRNLCDHPEGIIAGAGDNKPSQGFFSTAGSGHFWLTNASDLI